MRGEGMTECPVCVGEGCYPIHHKDGTELYCINCPECWGSGTIECDDPAEPKAEPPDPNQMVLFFG
jgi:hypothetical protein